MIQFPQKLESWPHQVLPLVELLLDPDSVESGVVICDAAQLDWILPIGLCGLAAACSVLANRGITVQFENLSPNMRMYFERMDVFDQCHIAYKSTIQRQDRSDRLLEIRCLDRPSEVHKVAAPLVNAITGQMMRGHEDSEDPEGMRAKPSERLALSLEYVMSELLENAVTHAQANGFAHAKVWIAANYYEQNNSVRVAFVDTGCGFKQSLRFDHEVQASPTDITAIRRALEPFVSCNRGVGIMDDSSNQGIGLTVCADIARETGGRLMVSSGDASLNATDNINYSHQGHWQGAAVDVVLQRDQLLNLDLSTVVRPYQNETRPVLRFV